MNIQDIKTQIAQENSIALPHLVMVQQFEEDGKTPAPWVSHWDNEKRLRITMHSDVFNRIKENPTDAGLALKKEVVPASAEREAYTRYVVITPQNIVGTF
jgi:hypothetical protein